MDLTRVPVPVFLVGVGGYGAIHLRNILRLQTTGQLKLTALVDPTVTPEIDPTTGTNTHDGYPLFNNLHDALQVIAAPRLVVIGAPIHLHYAIATEAMLAGADVLLEKPPCSRLDDYKALLLLEKQTGRSIQVGFQSLGSRALDILTDPSQMDIGTVLAIRARGMWVRRNAYWNRTFWAGRRTMGENDVMDGVTTNGFSHAVMAALYIAGARVMEDVQDMDIETYRANKVDVDDTTSLRIKLTNGMTVSCGFTLCASEQKDPVIEVVGTKGIAKFVYPRDELTIGTQTKVYGRDDLLENLLAFQEDGTPLRCPLSLTGPFMRVLETIRTGDQPIHIDSSHTSTHGQGDDAHIVVDDIEKWIHTAVESDTVFSKVGAPWAFTRRDTILAKAQIGSTTVLELVDGQGTIPESSPRPYIHPIRTLRGIEVTATHPADHDWHMGLGVAIPDVNGMTFWGGPTYARDKGYIPLDNQGTISSQDIKYIPSGSNSSPTGLDQSLVWLDTVGNPLLREQRELRWKPLDKLPGWQLDFRTSLSTIDQPVSLGGPGTNGRANAGYGGFFWRLPRCSNISITSPTAEGEDAVHGTITPWIAWAGRFEARPGAIGEATILITPGDSITAKDPWFVRQTGYPGIGSAIAWDRRVEIPVGGTTSRFFHCAILDGRVDRSGLDALARVLRGEGDRLE